MSASSSARIAGDIGTSDRPSFLASHRALAVCTRELGRLNTAIVEGVERLAATGAVEKPVVRMTPGRCIVQLGPVALTVAWLRSTLDTVAEGQLLAIVWQGAVAPQANRRPEQQASRNATAAPVALLEESLTVAGEDETSWAWRLTDDTAGFSSVDLAARYVSELQRAYDATRTA